MGHLMRNVQSLMEQCLLGLLGLLALNSMQWLLVSGAMPFRPFRHFPFYIQPLLSTIVVPYCTHCPHPYGGTLHSPSKP